MYMRGHPPVKIGTRDVSCRLSTGDFVGESIRGFGGDAALPNRGGTVILSPELMLSIRSRGTYFEANCNRNAFPRGEPCAMCPSVLPLPPTSPAARAALGLNETPNEEGTVSISWSSPPRTILNSLAAATNRGDLGPSFSTIYTEGGALSPPRGAPSPSVKLY